VRRSRRSLARVVAVPVVAAGIAGTAVFAAAPAFAQTITDTGGSAAVTEPFSYIGQLAKAHVVEVPLPPAKVSVDKPTQTVTTTFPVTGGNADTTTLSGALDVGGTLKIFSFQGRHLYHVTLTDIQVSLDADAILATPKGSTTPVALLDIGGDVVFSGSPTTGTETLTADDLSVDPAGAAYLDSALHTTAFQAGDDAGSLSATWTLTESS
jgi:hypothetical protein